MTKISRSKKPSHYTREQEEQLAHDNMGLVAKLALSFFPPSKEDLSDYIQAGSMGLLRAIRSHDPSLGQLTTYAWNPIRWEIIRHINKNKKTYEESSHISGSYELTEELQYAIPDSITEEERKVIYLKVEGYSFREIGQMLGGKSRNWSNKVYNEAVQRIREANSEEKNTICK